MPWNPQQYDLFQSARSRPGYDLMSALPEIALQQIVDLGCGTGHHARALADRWPTAHVIGIDNSAAMLATATRHPSRVVWELGDIGHWHAPAPMDLIFSNAALQWLPNHADLFLSLLDRLAPGGVLAVQMPRNFQAPSHALLAELAGEAPWAERLAGTLRFDPVAAPDWYWRLLSRQARSVEIWETEYLHVLDGSDPVLEWTKGTALIPVMAALPAAEHAAFLNEYGARLRRAYPAEPNGRTLFPFRRLFIMAHC